MIDKKYILVVSALLGAIVISISVGMALLPRDIATDGELPADRETSSLEEEHDVVRILAAGRDRASGLYDVMMLVSFDRTDRSACVLQIPRDTYFEYTDKSYKKINGAVSSLGGMSELCSFLGGALGVRIDSYISFDLDALAKAVDAIGGVEVELPEPLKYSDPEQGLYIDLPAGKQVLDGKAAEKFVRFRSGYLRGDLGRLDAQKLFMAAFFEKCRYSLSLSEAEKLIAVLLPCVRTDLGLFELVSLAADGLSVEGDALVFITAPGDDMVSDISGAWYYILSAESMRRVTEDYLGASEKSFDLEGLFLNERNPKSKAIYESEIYFEPITAESIGKDGVMIE